MAIICKEKILLASNINFFGNGFSLVAGYVDFGESLEDTVILEAKEEISIDAFWFHDDWFYCRG